MAGSSPPPVQQLEQVCDLLGHACGISGESGEPALKADEAVLPVLFC